MKTIAVSNGDIQLKNGKMQFAQGSEKLVQDLTRWLEEPLGTGWTTPGFGSLLYQMIGTSQTSGSVSKANSEINRVIQLYQGQQVINLRNAQNSAQLSLWNKNEIIKRIVSVDSTIQNNTIVAVARLETLNNNFIDMKISVTSNGVNIQNG